MDEPGYTLIHTINEIRILQESLDKENQLSIQAKEKSQWEFKGSCLYAGSFYRHFLIVGTEVILLLNKKTLDLEYKYSDLKDIKRCSATESYIIVFANNSEIIRFDYVEANSSLKPSLITVEDINPSIVFASDDLFFVADNSLNVIDILDSLNNSIVKKISIGKENVLRSLRYSNLYSKPYLLCGTADGYVLAYNIYRNEKNELEIGDKLALKVGSREVKLASVMIDSQETIVAMSDKTNVICNNSGHIKSIILNIDNITGICNLVIENELHYIISTTENLYVCTISQMKKLFCNPTPIKKQPGFVVYSPNSNVYIASFMNSIDFFTYSKAREGILIIMDDLKLSEFLYEFEEKETSRSAILIYSKALADPLPHSIPASASNIQNVNEKDKLHDLMVVGTTFVDPEESLPTKGRLIVFEIIKDRLIEKCHTYVKGAVMGICMHGKKIIVAINNYFALYCLEAKKTMGADIEEFDLAEKAKKDRECGTLITSINSNGTIILVGDMVNSVSTYRYNEKENDFEEIAKCMVPIWCTSVYVVDSIHYLVADDRGLLYSLSHRIDNCPAIGNQKKFDEIIIDIDDVFEVGGQINSMKYAPLEKIEIKEGMKDKEPSEVDKFFIKVKEELNKTHQIIFSTNTGAVGSLIQISEGLFKILHEVQKSMEESKEGSFDIEYNLWKKDHSKLKYKSQKYNIINGDLVESFLSMSEVDRQKVMEKVKYAEFPTISKDIIELLNLFEQLH